MTKRLKITFGAPKTSYLHAGDVLELQLKVPHLGGAAEESYSCDAPSIETTGAFAIMHGSRQTMGVCVVPVRFPLQETIYQVYRELLEICQGRTIYRIWNFVPFINAETEGLENYKSFSIGRSMAFERAFGQQFHQVLPAASAVGVEDNVFALYFVAGFEDATHVENPEQVSAFKYPTEYGPRPPSFARGTRSRG